MTTTPPTPPPLGGTPRTGWGTDRPRSLAFATIGLTAAVVVAQYISAIMLRDMLAHYSDYGRPDATFDTSMTIGMLVSSLSNLAMVGAYVTLGLWMMKMRRRLVNAGLAPQLGEVWIWVGWIIPLANLVLPYVVMQGLNRRAKSWAVLPWWLVWIASGVVVAVGTVRDLVGMDFSAIGKDPNNPLAGFDLPHTGDAMVTSAYVLAVAWILLAVVLTQITARDGERPGLPEGTSL